MLVVANVTASSDDLLAELQRLAGLGPTRFTLIVPASPFGGGREGAALALRAALERFRQAGLTADGQLGDADPCVAVTETYDPKRHDHIVVSTLPLGSSKWLHAGLPERIAKLTGATVSHVVARPRPQPPVAQPVPPRPIPLSPLLAPYAAVVHTEPPGRPLR